MSTGHGHSHGGSDRRRLAIALAVTVVVLLMQAIGSLFTGSLALLADAGHLLTDVLGLTAALVAATLARRPPSTRRSYGLGRAEILAAAVNALVLLVVCVVVTIEAISRFADPPAVPGAPLLVIGVLGLAGNLVALAVLAGGDRSSLNLRGALMEVAGDALGSVAVIVAAVVLITTGWTAADPVASLVVAALIAPRAVSLLRQAAHVLLEGVPEGIEPDRVRAALLAVPGVTAVHDLHLWTITSGQHAVSAHLVVDDGVGGRCGDQSVLDAAATTLSGEFGLTHSTLQVEHADHAAHEHSC